MSAHSEIRDLWAVLRAGIRNPSDRIAALTDRVEALEERIATPDVAEDPERHAPEPEHWTMAPGTHLTIHDADGKLIAGPIPTDRISIETDLDGQFERITTTIYRRSM